MSVIMPGSYDPVTIGHLEMIRRVAKVNDQVYVVIFNNPNKTYTFSLEDRVAMLMIATDDIDNVLVSYSSGLVIDYMREHGIERIVKGYRNERDLSWEKEQAEYNLKYGGYETELVLCEKGLESVSSSAVRELLLSGKSASHLLPPGVDKYIEKINRKEEIK